MAKNYIFFDVECANCFDGKGKICTFGYVVTDNRFNILQKEDILINPNVAKWDWYVVKNILAYRKRDFVELPKFDAFYTKIKDLLTQNTVCGFDVGLDIKYVNQDCARYGLPAIDVECFDVQELHKVKMGHELKKGLLGAAAELNLDLSGLNPHKSCDDAEISMMVMKTLTLGR